jgi:peptide deformylase
MDVKRPEVVEISYKDENGRPQTLKAGDLLGRCIQHEMDHLNGVVFVDRVDNSLTLAQELSKNGFSYQAVKPVA